jgi:hypothetical protein
MILMRQPGHAAELLRDYEDFTSDLERKLPADAELDEVRIAYAKGRQQVRDAFDFVSSIGTENMRRQGNSDQP